MEQGGLTEPVQAVHRGDSIMHTGARLSVLA